jgi:hypothetical protein
MDSSMAWQSVKKPDSGMSRKKREQAVRSWIQVIT